MILARFKVLAGDFRPGDGSISGGDMHLQELGANAFSGHIQMSMRSVASAEIATEASVKRAGGTIGWGIAGGVLLGPVGLLAGALLGGRGKDVVFVVVLRNGQKFLAKADTKVYEAFLAAAFSAQRRAAISTSNGPTIDDALSALRRLNADHDGGRVDDASYEAQKAAIVARL